MLVEETVLGTKHLFYELLELVIETWEIPLDFRYGFEDCNYDMTFLWHIKNSLLTF